MQFIYIANIHNIHCNVKFKKTRLQTFIKVIIQISQSFISLLVMSLPFCHKSWSLISPSFLVLYLSVHFHDRAFMMHNLLK